MSPRTSACGPNRADPPTTTTSPFTSPLMLALPPMTTTSPRTYSSLSTETLPPMRTMSSRRRARGVRGTSGSMRSVEPGSSVGAVGSAGFAGGVLPAASDRRAVESRYESCSTISASAGPRRSLQFAPGDRRAVDRDRRVRKLYRPDRRLESRRQHHAVRDRHDLEARLEPRAKFVDIALRGRGDHRQHQQSRRRYESSCHCGSSLSDINNRCSAESDSAPTTAVSTRPVVPSAVDRGSRHRDARRRQHVEHPHGRSARTA